MYRVRIGERNLRYYFSCYLRRPQPYRVMPTPIFIRLIRTIVLLLGGDAALDIIIALTDVPRLVSNDNATKLIPFVTKWSLSGCAVFNVIRRWDLW